MVEDGLVPKEGQRWNHNLHYLPVILRAVPEGCERALDVGCGEGTLTRQIRRLVPDVTGIDLDARSIELATAHPDARDIHYLLGHFLAYPFERESFDLITSVAALHHMDAAAALERIRDLLRPGGVVAILGLARRRFPADFPLELAGVLVSRFHRLTRTYWESPSPTVWPPPESFAAMRHLATRLLPGARYRRHVLWRYSLTWNKPPTEPSS